MLSFLSRRSFFLLLLVRGVMIGPEEKKVMRNGKFQLARDLARASERMVPVMLLWIFYFYLTLTLFSPSQYFGDLSGDPWKGK